MKNFRKIFAVFAAAAISSNIHASVSIQFSSIVGNVLSGFANSAGVPTDGMMYGIVVDTGGNGFNAGSYTAFDPTVGGFLSSLGGLTDDYFWSAVGNSSPDPSLQTGLTFDTTGFPELGGGVGGPGSIFDILEVPFGGMSAIALNDVFQIIWFESNSANAGDNYGMFSHSSFLIPADGSLLTLDGNFGSTDPAKTASFEIQAIPEPSRALLLGLAGMLTLFRRRRA